MQVLKIYQIQKTYFSNTLGRLTYKIYNTSNNVQIVCKKNDINIIDDILWTFDKLSFIPHHTENDNISIEGIKSVYITTTASDKYDNIIYISHTPTIYGHTTYIIDTQCNKYNEFVKKLPKYRIKIHTQKNDGSWETK